MKTKILLVILSGLLVVSLVLLGACAQPEGPGAPVTKTVTKTATKTETTTSTVTAPAKTVTAAAAAPEEEVFEWKWPHYLPRGGSIDWSRDEQWTKDVDAASGGRLKITLYGDGELIPCFEAFDACSMGTIDFFMSYPAFWLGKVPAAGLGGLPFTTRDMVDALTLHEQYGLGDVIRKAYAEHNLYHVRSFPYSDARLTTKSPITKASDFNGMNLRVSGLGGEVLTEAGAAITYFPGGEIYGALEKGVLDGAMYGSFGNQVDMSFHEVCNYVLWDPIVGGDTIEYLVNMDTWNKLPDDLKELLDISAGHHSLMSMASCRGYDAEQLVEAEKLGLSATTLSSGERKIMTELATKVFEKYAAEDKYFAEGWEIAKAYLQLNKLL